MTGGVLAGLALALGAAVATAGAHALLKSGSDKLATRFLIGAVGSAVAVPVLFLAPLPSSELWPWLAASAILHLIYQLVLIRAYEAADFSLAFPVARGIAPVASAILGVAFLGDRLTPLSLLGVAVVTAGLLALSFRSGLSRTGLVAAMTAGVLTTAYTLVDAQGVRLAAEPLTFIAWFFLLDGLVMTPVFVFARRGRMGAVIRKDRGRGVWAGLVSLIGFGATLWALALAPAGAVSALRETSVVFAMLIAGLGLREVLSRGRMACGLAIAAGAALVVLGAA